MKCFPLEGIFVCIPKSDFDFTDAFYSVKCSKLKIIMD